MTLLIADISSHNTITSWSAFLASVDGCVVKATQGTTYAWPGAPAALAQIRAARKLAGVYHFAGNLVGADTIPADPVAEANWLLAHYTHVPGEPIFLDWEPSKAPADPDAWAYAFCQRITAVTGVLPPLYLNNYYATRQSQWPRTRALGCALWAAWYGANTGQPLPGMPSFAPWPAPAMWQYSSNGTRPGVSGVLDLNQFYGNADQWRAYGKPGTSGGFLMALSDAQQTQLLSDADQALWILGQIKPSIDALRSTISEARDYTAAPESHVDDVGGHVYQARQQLDAIEAALASLAQAATPTIDEAKLAAALLADPKNVDALGAAIAAHLKLSSD